MIFISVIFDIIVFGILIPTAFVKASEVIDRFFQFSKFDFIALKATGLFLSGSGIIFIVWAYYFLVKIGTGYTVEFFGKGFLPQTKRLVKTGPYFKVRHPMAGGYLIALLGLAFFKGSVSGIFIAFPFLFIITSLYLLIFEEKTLYNRFGDEFKDYKSNTYFLIPWFRK